MDLYLDTFFDINDLMPLGQIIVSSILLRIFLVLAKNRSTIAGRAAIGSLIFHIPNAGITCIFE